MLRGQITVGRTLYLSVLRHYEDLESGPARGLAFVPACGQHVIDTIEKFFTHTKGPLARKPILLDPWQRFWTAVLYGWRRADTGLRRFSRGYEKVARKNGKSTWKGPQAFHLFALDGEAGAEVYTMATTRAQAMTVFGPVFSNLKRWAAKSPGVKRSFKIYEGLNQERIVMGDGVFAPLPSNAENLDGINPSVVVYDELHAAKSREQWDVMESALGARDQPLMTAITTAGYILDGICVEMEKYLISVLEGVREDDALFGYCYDLDPDDDPFDEGVWPKANPGLGMSKKWDYMRTQARKAKALPSALVNFMTKDLNRWVNSSDGWFDITVWDKGGKRKATPDVLASLKGRKCYGGLDLASTRDLTALSLVFPPLGDDDDWVILVWHWCPLAKIETQEHDDAAPYRRWQDEGWLTGTDGNVTDYTPVKQKVLWAMHEFELVQLGFDKWNAQQLANELIELGAPLVEVPQNTGGMYPGSKKLEELVYAERVEHFGNPVLRWCASNVALLFDSNGNFRPDKKRSKLNGRIDGIVATVMALTRAVAVEEPSSFWESQGA
ncbi:MAG: terminase large subunit [Rubrivivax sp.]|nr:MAG: terminase large subunit [Rubrivivax sp.]